MVPQGSRVALIEVPITKESCSGLSVYSLPYLTPPQCLLISTFSYFHPCSHLLKKDKWYTVPVSVFMCWTKWSVVGTLGWDTVTLWKQSSPPIPWALGKIKLNIFPRGPRYTQRSFWQPKFWFAQGKSFSSWPVWPDEWDLFSCWINIFIHHGVKYSENPKQNLLLLEACDPTGFYQEDQDWYRLFFWLCEMAPVLSTPCHEKAPSTILWWHFPCCNCCFYSPSLLHLICKGLLPWEEWCAVIWTIQLRSTDSILTITHIDHEIKGKMYALIHCHILAPDWNSNNRQKPWLKGPILIFSRTLFL